VATGIIKEGVVQKRFQGIPQGSPLSPLLSNIVLDELDKELERRGHRFCRYADDLQIYVGSKEAGNRVYKSITRFIELRLKLKVNRDKSQVVANRNSTFLGYSFLGIKPGKVKMRFSKETITRFKYRIKQITRGHHRRNMDSRMMELNQYIRGWMNYFRLIETKRVLKDLDSWIRSRLRMCLLKQWYRPKTRIKRLAALGAKRKYLGAFACYGKHWHLANHPLSRFHLNIKYWEIRGYKGLEFYWNIYGKT